MDGSVENLTAREKITDEELKKGSTSKIKQKIIKFEREKQK